MVETREDLPEQTVELADALLSRLELIGGSGRVELEFRAGRLVQLRRHEVFSRDGLERFDASSS